MVVQHAILVAVWHMFSRGALHEDLGADHFQAHDKERQTRYLLRRLHKLSVDVQVQGMPPERYTHPAPIPVVSQKKKGSSG